MGHPLMDLEQVLHSRKEKLTIEEATILLQWRAKAMRDFTIGFGGGSVVTTLATRRLSNLARLNFSLGLGAGAFCGLWNFKRSIKSCAEHILSLEGSRIQRELATIMLKQYRDDPWILQRLSKHFYSEQVYEDSSTDKPIFRWRFRNFYSDPAEPSQSTSFREEFDFKNDTSYNEEADLQKNTFYSKEIGMHKNETKQTGVKPKHVNVNVADVAEEDPFGFIFEHPKSAEDDPQPDASSRPSKRQQRRERRLHRRHRSHPHKDEDSEI